MPLTEFSLISRYFSHLGRGPAVDLAVGDDCAILRLDAGERLATSVDTMLVGVHFPPDTQPAHIAWRAVSAAASDLAAMGARPLGMTVALTLPEANEVWLAGFSDGLAATVAEYRLPLVGGDTTRGPLSISVQVMGALPADRALLRSGAVVGDHVYVSGTLGDAAGALGILRDEWQTAPEHAQYLLDRFNHPRARLELGRELLGHASAAIDISDGLLADAAHVSSGSGVKIIIEADRLPLSTALLSRGCRDTILRWALTGGDDYELCFCLPAGERPPGGTTRIGHVEAGVGVECFPVIDAGFGYQHFGDSNLATGTTGAGDGV
jgi:thiamine-monophosphate kinase